MTESGILRGFKPGEPQMINRRAVILQSLPVLTGSAAMAASVPVLNNTDIPKRLSTNKSDPGYKAWKQNADQGRYFKVLLNDIERTQCIMADVELGVIERGKTTPSGDLILTMKLPSTDARTEMHKAADRRYYILGEIDYYDVDWDVEHEILWGKVEIVSL
jgi:hypothetical protein